MKREPRDLFYFVAMAAMTAASPAYAGWTALQRAETAFTDRISFHPMVGGRIRVDLVIPRSCERRFRFSAASPATDIALQVSPSAAAALHCVGGARSGAPSVTQSHEVALEPNATSTVRVLGTADAPLKSAEFRGHLAQQTFERQQSIASCLSDPSATHLEVAQALIALLPEALRGDQSTRLAHARGQLNQREVAELRQLVSAVNSVETARAALRRLRADRVLVSTERPQLLQDLANTTLRLSGTDGRTYAEGLELRQLGIESLALVSDLSDDPVSYDTLHDNVRSTAQWVQARGEQLPSWLTPRVASAHRFYESRVQQQCSTQATALCGTYRAALASVSAILNPSASRAEVAAAPAPVAPAVQATPAPAQPSVAAATVPGAGSLSGVGIQGVPGLAPSVAQPTVTVMGPNGVAQQIPSWLAARGIGLMSPQLTLQQPSPVVLQTLPNGTQIMSAPQASANISPVFQAPAQRLVLIPVGTQQVPNGMMLSPQQVGVRPVNPIPVAQCTGCIAPPPALVYNPSFVMPQSLRGFGEAALGINHALNGWGAAGRGGSGFGINLQLQAGFAAQAGARL